MTKIQWNRLAIGCFIASVILLFVAFERYQSNASEVSGLKVFLGGTPLGPMMLETKPATPAATKYALFFAALSAGGGAACLVQARKAPFRVS